MAWARGNQTVPVLEQWQRTVRWHNRLREMIRKPLVDCSPDDYVDHFFAFFQNCYMMRDWLLNSKIAPRSEVQALYGSRELRLCRDITNGTKHLELRQPSVDSSFMVAREYDPSHWAHATQWQSSFRLSADGRRYDLFELTNDCRRQLEDFLHVQGILLMKSEIGCGLGQGA